MVARTKSELTIVSTPFSARDRLSVRARYDLAGGRSSGPQTQITQAIYKPKRVPISRATAIDSSPNAHSPGLGGACRQRPGSPLPKRNLPQVLPSVAMSRVHHGKQNAHRCVTPGGNPGRGAPRIEGRGI